MSQTKVRRFTLLAADAVAGEISIELSPTNLGFNPSQEFGRCQISCNAFDAAGKFQVAFKSPGDSSGPFLDFLQEANAGVDIVIIGLDEDPIFDSLKISFSGVAATDVELYCGFSQE